MSMSLFSVSRTSKDEATFVLELVLRIRFLRFSFYLYLVFSVLSQCVGVRELKLFLSPGSVSFVRFARVSCPR